MRTSRASGFVYLGTLTVPSFTQRSDYVDGIDQKDFYRFTLDAMRDVTITLSGLSSNADLLLQDDAGGTIASSSNGSSVDDQIAQVLSAGTYFVRVKHGGGAGTNYDLSVLLVSAVRLR